MKKSLIEINERCQKVGLKTKEYIYKEDDSDLEDEVTEQEGLIVQIPEERDSKNIFIIDDTDLKKVKKSKFEYFKFIKGYEAIWSSELGIVECEIQSGDIIRGGTMLMRRLSRYFTTSESESSTPKKNEDSIFEFPSPMKGVKIMIGGSSIEFSILESFQREYLYYGGRIRRRPTIQILGVNISTHREAKDLLTSIGNSVFFQIDLAVNIPLHLTIDRELFRDIRIRRRAKKADVEFIPPKYEYDNEPMSLYWYARTAINMPLLQFLAFYQVLEFYFPQYSYMEAQQKIKNLLKNPTFNANKDSDISQILNIIKVTSKGKSYGDEKDQLKATVLHCIDKASMFDYLIETEERKDFFDNQKKNKGLAKHKIPFSNIDHDIRIDVSQRIYEIRCRIVHTKDEQDLELLLPFAPEVRNIKHDLELVEYLARKAIMAGGRQLTIKNK